MSRPLRSRKSNPENQTIVTPEMIDAGMREYNARWRGLRDADDDVAREMLIAAFMAMEAVRP